jgi:hypothetical protein
MEIPKRRVNPKADGPISTIRLNTVPKLIRWPSDPPLTSIAKQFKIKPTAPAEPFAMLTAYRPSRVNPSTTARCSGLAPGGRGIGVPLAT